jgi:hypothetical protein
LLFCDYSTETLQKIPDKLSISRPAYELKNIFAQAAVTSSSNKQRSPC